MSVIRRLVPTVATTVMLVASPIVAGAAPSPAGEPATDACRSAPTDGTVTRQLGGRTYLLHVPAGLPDSPVPMLLSLHGYGEPPSFHEEETGWSEAAAGRRFMVAYPEGRERHWDFAAGSPDVVFLRQVVADISGSWCVDPHRVYAEGYSNGAMMVERLACDAPDVFAAVAAYGGASPAVDSPCSPARPVAVGIFQSLLDPISSYPVGVQNRDEWVARNACPSTPATEAGVLLEASRYAPCSTGVEVIWRVYERQSHNWPTGADRADITDRMWALFERNPLP